MSQQLCLYIFSMVCSCSSWYSNQLGRVRSTFGESWTGDGSQQPVRHLDRWVVLTPQPSLLSVPFLNPTRMPGWTVRPSRRCSYIWRSMVPGCPNMPMIGWDQLRYVDLPRGAELKALISPKKSRVGGLWTWCRSSKKPVASLSPFHFQLRRFQMQGAVPGWIMLDLFWGSSTLARAPSEVGCLAEAKPGVQQRPLREGRRGVGLMEARWTGGHLGRGVHMMNEVEVGDISIYFIHPSWMIAVGCSDWYLLGSFSWTSVRRWAGAAVWSSGWWDI